MSTLAYGIDGLEAVFDEGSLIADAGLLSAGSVMDRLGSEALIDEAVRPAQAGRGSGHKVLSLVSSMLLGGVCIDDADRLRAGSVQAVLPFVVAAPSTLGSFLGPSRKCGIVGCCDRLAGHVIRIPRAAKLAGLVKPWAVLRRTWRRLSVSSMRPLETLPVWCQASISSDQEMMVSTM